jgi:hypothetical protein
MQEKYTLKLGSDHAINFTAGQFVLNENSFATGAQDPYLFMEQIDWTAKWHPKFSTRFGVATYSIVNQQSISQTLESAIGGSNNGTPAAGQPAVAPDGTLLYPQDFNPIIGRAEATYSLSSFPLYTGEFPITFGFEYVNNPSASGQFTYTTTQNGKTTENTADQGYFSRQNEAYSAGVTFGSTKIKKNWQIGYTYKNIQAAALWRGMMDDNFGYATTSAVPTSSTTATGKTTSTTLGTLTSTSTLSMRGGGNVRGHLVSASYRVFDPMTIGIQYFKTEAIINSSKALGDTDRVLVDVIWTF